MKGNRQGSLSRSITRRSDQNRKIKYCFLFCDFASACQKVRSDFFDKLSRPKRRLFTERAEWTFRQAVRSVNRCGLFYVLYKSDKKKQNNLEHKTIYISLVKW